MLYYATYGYRKSNSQSTLGLQCGIFWKFIQKKCRDLFLSIGYWLDHEKWLFYNWTEQDMLSLVSSWNTTSILFVEAFWAWWEKVLICSNTAFSNIFYLLFIFAIIGIYFNVSVLTIVKIYKKLHYLQQCSKMMTK